MPLIARAELILVLAAGRRTQRFAAYYWKTDTSDVDLALLLHLSTFTLFHGL